MRVFKGDETGQKVWYNNEAMIELLHGVTVLHPSQVLRVPWTTNEEQLRQALDVHQVAWAKYPQFLIVDYDE